MWWFEKRDRRIASSSNTYMIDKLNSKDLDHRRQEIKWGRLAQKNAPGFDLDSSLQSQGLFQDTEPSASRTAEVVPCRLHHTPEKQARQEFTSPSAGGDAEIRAGNGWFTITQLVVWSGQDIPGKAL